MQILAYVTVLFKPASSTGTATGVDGSETLSSSLRQITRNVSQKFSQQFDKALRYYLTFILLLEIDKTSKFKRKTRIDLNTTRLTS